jgi:hypothetical protein
MMSQSHQVLSQLRFTISATHSTLARWIHDSLQHRDATEDEIRLLEHKVADAIDDMKELRKYINAVGRLMASRQEQSELFDGHGVIGPVYELGAGVNPSSV